MLFSTHLWPHQTKWKWQIHTNIWFLVFLAFAFFLLGFLIVHSATRRAMQWHELNLTQSKNQNWKFACQIWFFYIKLWSNTPKNWTESNLIYSKFMEMLFMRQFSNVIQLICRQHLQTNTYTHCKDRNVLYENRTYIPYSYAAFSLRCRNKF